MSSVRKIFIAGTLRIQSDMRKKIDRSIIEKYREQYEAGLITIEGIARREKIGVDLTGKYTLASKWNVALAKINRREIEKQILLDKINQCKEAFEQGTITIVQIMKSLKCCFDSVRECIKRNKWDCTVNDGKYNLTKIARKRKKIKSIVSSFKIGEIFYTSEGLPLIFRGIKNGKPTVKHTLCTKHTYTHQEIKNIENEYE